MLITALLCPVLKPMRWGKGLSEGTTIHFVSEHGWAWHLMQFLQMISVLISRHAKPMTLLHLQCIRSRQLQK